MGLAIALLSGSTSNWFAGTIAREDSDSPGSALAVADLLPVKTQTLQLQTSYAVERRYTGKLVGRRVSELGFERPGKLIRVAVDVGDTVAAGTTLAALDTQSLRLQVQELDTQQTQAQSQLQELKAGPHTPTINAAQANVRGVQSQLNLAQQRSTRRQSLYAQGAISREQRDEALTQVSNLQAQVDEANSRLQELLAGGRPEQLRSQAARIEQLQVQEAQLATEQANSRLQAPFAGQIAARLADEGTVVTAGQPILRLVEAGPLEAQVGVRPRSGPTQTRQPPEASHR